MSSTWDEDDISAIVGAHEFRPQTVPKVYFLISNGKIIYIGQTYKIEARISSHKKDKAFDKVLAIDVIDHKELSAVETAFIKICAPPLNKSGVGTPNQSDFEIFKRFGGLSESIERHLNKKSFVVENMRFARPEDGPGHKIIISPEDEECSGWPQKLIGKTGYWDDSTTETLERCLKYDTEEHEEDDFECEDCYNEERAIIYVDGVSGYYLAAYDEFKIIEETEVTL